MTDRREQIEKLCADLRESLALGGASGALPLIEAATGSGEAEPDDSDAFYEAVRLIAETPASSETPGVAVDEYEDSLIGLARLIIARRDSGEAGLAVACYLESDLDSEPDAGEQ